MPTTTDDWLDKTMRELLEILRINKADEVEIGVPLDDKELIITVGYHVRKVSDDQIDYKVRSGLKVQKGERI